MKLLEVSVSVQNLAYLTASFRHSVNVRSLSQRHSIVRSLRRTIAIPSPLLKLRRPWRVCQKRRHKDGVIPACQIADMCLDPGESGTVGLMTVIGYIKDMRSPFGKFGKYVRISYAQF